jgi:hypothetical protein
MYVCVCVCVCVFPGAHNDHNRKVEKSYPQNQVTFARCYAGWFQPPRLGDPRDLGETARAKERDRDREGRGE